MSVSRKLFPSLLKVSRRGAKGEVREGFAYEPAKTERPVMDRYTEDHKAPEQRLAEHKESVAHRGPYANTVRLHLRLQGDERPLVRRMYDATEVKRGKRPRKATS